MFLNLCCICVWRWRVDVHCETRKHFRLHIWFVGKECTFLPKVVSKLRGAKAGCWQIGELGPTVPCRHQVPGFGTLSRVGAARRRQQKPVRERRDCGRQSSPRTLTRCNRFSIGFTFLDALASPEVRVVSLSDPRFNFEGIRKSVSQQHSTSDITRID